ncbi:MAG TPA: PilZ domain-containing protein [Oligoflexus sp.]|uniref:PilZ domain-containing protein n=1 Tax=Oligoflexus sp. TaxID=1971216 RepID=UPI002D2E21E2|nr:PilZ domain-containing protein [Oligoflexus sp.]HYX37815.1 PilZ domain-containing protein [Oligoflexus sp.]
MPHSNMSITVQYPLEKKTNRRRYPRIPVRGRAQVFFQGQALAAGICEVSRCGARLLIQANELSFKTNDRLMFFPKNGALAMAFVCDVRYINVHEGEGSEDKTFAVGLEHVASDQNQPDLLSLLLDNGAVTIPAETADLMAPGTKEGCVIRQLREGVRQSSRSRIVGPNQAMPLILEIPENSPSSSDNCWKVTIGIQSAAMCIHFSSCYQPEAAHGFLSWTKNRPENDFQNHICHDFMREFCNLTAGAFKIWVERHAGSLLYDKDIRVKLPVHGPIMEDEICALPSLQDAMQVRDAWRLELPSGTGISCMVEIIIWSWPDVASLQLEEKTLELLSSAGDEQDDGSVEFL